MAAEDQYQRSAEIYAMRTSASGGAQRGEEIYYYPVLVLPQVLENGPPPQGPLQASVSAYRDEEDPPPQQNLWVVVGSGSAPSV